MKKYIKAEVEIIELPFTDVVRTSGEGDNMFITPFPEDKD